MPDPSLVSPERRTFGEAPLRPAPATPRTAHVTADLDRLLGAASAPTFAPEGHGLLHSGVARYRTVRGKLELVGPPPPRRRSGRSVETAGRLVYAVGDVHGRYDLLIELLGKILHDSTGRDPEREPVLVVLGDYVDRGPDSALVVEALVELQRRWPWSICLLKGNHEQALLQFLEEPARGGAWLRFGGAETLAAYGVKPPERDDPVALHMARDALLAAMPASHLRLLERTESLVVIGDYAFVHAGVAPGAALERQSENDLLWIRDEFLAAERACDRIVVHGHTWTGDTPALLESRIGVDTGAYETGVLTAVRLVDAERAVIQARDPHSPWLARQRDARTPRLVARPADFTQGGWESSLRIGW